MKQVFIAVLLSLASTQLQAHCQIPCGIYHDQMVVNGLEEDIETLQKSVSEIEKNARSTPLEANQFVRWVINKEKQADKFSDTLVEYFLKQRIKPDAEKLDQKLKSIHNMLVLSMKIKQTVDPSLVNQLNEELHHFTGLMYPEQKHEGH